MKSLRERAAHTHDKRSSLSSVWGVKSSTKLRDEDAEADSAGLRESRGYK
jgi:hypothetical protein